MCIILYFALLIIAIFIFWLYFSRIPFRETVSDDVILSPANGKIIAIESIDTEWVSFFKDGIRNELEIHDITLPAYVIVIQMNLKNVHVQRAPIAGEIIQIKHFNGKFKNALYSKQKTHLVNANEKNLTVIKGENETIAVVQVAGQLARRIRSYVKTGNTVSVGEKIGFINFGSQVVLVIPQKRILQIQVGDIVTDGKTVIAQ